MAIAEKPKPRVKIRGGAYASFDTKDGFFSVKNVPIFSEVPKGVKDAPEDIGAIHMQAMVDFGQSLYQNGKFAAPVHRGHNKMLAVQDPEFLGFFLPTHVGKMTLGGKEQSVVFADLKLKEAAFQRVLAGELPYFSPEVDWETMSFTSLASLDSQPPHFKFPVFTVLPPVDDEDGKFEVKLTNLAVFQADQKKPKKDEEGDGEKHEEPDGDEKKPFGGGDKSGGAGPGGGSSEARIIAMETLMMQVAKMLGLPFGGIDMSDQNASRPGGAPAEQPNEPAQQKANVAQAKADAKMSAEEAGSATKFAAYEGRIAALEAKDAARIEQDRIDALTKKALNDLTGYPLTDGVREKIGKFAKAGEEVVKAFVDAYKESVPKDTPRTKAEFEANPSDIAPSDPLIVKFSAQGPKHVEAAMKALAEHRELSKLKGFTVSAEKHLAIRVPELVKNA